jgi:hypothetical protein
MLRLLIQHVHSVTKFRSAVKIHVSITAEMRVKILKICYLCFRVYLVFVHSVCGGTPGGTEASYCRGDGPHTDFPKRLSSVIPGKFLVNTMVGQKIGIQKVSSAVGRVQRVGK